MSDTQNNVAPRTLKPVAVIDVGTTSIRMAIAEIDDNGSVRTMETLSQAVTLGKDTFTHGAIDKATIEDCVRVLKVYRQKLLEYQITQPEQIRVVATSAVREATNRLAFLDRVYIATGLEIDPIDEAEVSRVTYMGIQPYLESEPSLAAATTIVTEVGGGSTELLVVHNGNVTFSETYRLGSLRLRKTLETYHTPSVKVRDVMASQVRRTAGQIRPHLPANAHLEMIALGGDVRYAASELDPGWSGSEIAKLPIDALEMFTNRILSLSVDEVVQKHHLSYPDAETIGPALLAYVQLAHAFNLSHVLVTNTNLRDGMLQEMAAKEAWAEEFNKQVIRSAIDLGQRFEFDEAHARHVAELSKSLFQALKDEHQLPARYEIILYVAALLHEIGLFVNNRAYHKHSLYLICNSDLFGLGKTELLLVALVARYHRRASPQPTHEYYSDLDRERRVVVAKLAAILRIAIALDESRSQRISNVVCNRKDGQLIISVPGVEDLSLEQLSLQQNGSLFEEIYGMSVLLRTVGR